MISPTDYGDVVAGAMAAGHPGHPEHPGHDEHEGIHPRPQAQPQVGGPQIELSQQPIFKAAGGKRRLVPTLMQHVPSHFNRYIEPFCGGAALFFAIAPRQDAILGDLNVELVDLYAALAHDVERVITCFDVHVRDHAADAHRHYYSMRDVLNDDMAELGLHERAALVLYINRASFNGLWRMSAKGRFNVPIGRGPKDRITGERGYKSVAIDPDRLRGAAAILARARLLAGDYRSTIAMAAPGDFIYFDPPYDDSFTSYTRNGFDQDEQGSLAGNARALVDRGVHVLLSNHDTPMIRELYSDRTWHVTEIAAPRSIAANGSKRQPARELLIASYAPRRAS
jgi:DNA adenine methylase